MISDIGQQPPRIIPPIQRRLYVSDLSGAWNQPSGGTNPEQKRRNGSKR